MNSASSDHVHQSSSKVVYYDGTCPMCTAFVGGVSKTAQSNLILQDVTTAPLPSSFSKDEVLREMHVIDDKGVIHTNAAAVLTILDDVPYWRRVTWMGRLMGVRSILPLFYNIIARNRHFMFGPASRVWWLKQITIIGLLSGIVMSFPLWVTTGAFPKAPLFSWLPGLSSVSEGLVLAIIFFCALTSIFSSRPQKYLLAVVLMIIFLIFFDQSRLQPWVFQYTSMLFIFGFFSWHWKDIRGRIIVLHTLRLTIASMYIFSGLQKITYPFFTSIFPWMTEPITQLLPATLYVLPMAFGLFVPFIEIAIGLGLLVRRFRNLALVGVLCMLVFVLYTLGPFGLNWNSVVWPWNVILACMAFILFYRTDRIATRDIFKIENFLRYKIILALFLIMPAFSFIGFWDSYLSFSLYSGNVAEARIYNLNVDPLPVLLQPHLKDVMSRKGFVNVRDWSYATRNVPAYPEVRVYKSIFKSVCSFGMNDKAVLEIYTRATLLSGKSVQKFSCSDVVP